MHIFVTFEVTVYGVAVLYYLKLSGVPVIFKLKNMNQNLINPNNRAARMKQKKTLSF